MKHYTILGSLLFATSVALGCYFICDGINHFADKDRCVKVRGLAEMEMLANRVVWPMNVTTSSKTIQGACDSIIAKKDLLVKFLTDHGIPDSCISISSVDVEEELNNEGKPSIPTKYLASVAVTVTSSDVKNIMELMNRQSDLLKLGVSVTTRDYDVRYELIGLTDLKPEMIEDATKDARRVAEKFAKDANCHLGSIRNATQGQFTIEEDYHRPQYKIIRVVTYISYYLK